MKYLLLSDPDRKRNNAGITLNNEGLKTAATDEISRHYRNIERGNDLNEIEDIQSKRYMLNYFF